MAEAMTPHTDVAAYLLGRLEPGERATFEQHLASCPECRLSQHELSPVVELLTRAAPPVEVPQGLEARTLLAVERAARQEEPARKPDPVRRRSLLSRRLVFGFAPAVALAALALAFVLGRQAAGDETPGPAELEAVLVRPGGVAVAASARVVKTGIGRIISFRSDELPILPTGEYYELWFVGPGDTPRRPNRISAGTFHPDEQGRSQVTFAAAVDPTKYPVLSVTAEPGDGNPQPTGPDVLRSRP